MLGELKEALQPISVVFAAFIGLLQNCCSIMFHRTSGLLQEFSVEEKEPAREQTAFPHTFIEACQHRSILFQYCCYAIGLVFDLLLGQNAPNG